MWSNFFISSRVFYSPTSLSNLESLRDLNKCIVRTSQNEDFRILDILTCQIGMLEGVTHCGNVWHVGFHKSESIFRANSEDDAFTFYENQHAINSYILTLVILVPQGG